MLLLGENHGPYYPKKKIIIFFNDVKTTESDENPFEFFNTCHRYHEIISIAFLSRGSLHLSPPPGFYVLFLRKKHPDYRRSKKQIIFSPSNFFYDPRFFKRSKLFTRRRIFVFWSVRFCMFFSRGGKGRM